MICELTGLEVSNASMYDGATALAEALILCCGVHRKKKKVVVTRSIFPEYLQVASTYLRHFGVEIVEVDLENGRVDPDKVRAAAEGAAGVAIQSPNYLGLLEDGPAIAEAAHDASALCVAVCDPVSLGLLEAPGVEGMDVAVGDGQGLGCPVSYGGPAFGFFATKEKFVRSMPGRVVGATMDDQGRRGFVLTFQTREQHIRREKATSNICTNQGLMALRAAIHMALLGPAGLHEVASTCARNSHEAARACAEVPGFELLHDRPFFKEFPLLCPVPAEEVVESMMKDGFMAGVPANRLGADREDVLLVAVTEKRTSVEIAAFADALKKRFGGAAR
jgi:glycine dehydrogenase subunit 1